MLHKNQKQINNIQIFQNDHSQNRGKNIQKRRAPRKLGQNQKMVRLTMYEQTRT